MEIRSRKWLRQLLKVVLLLAVPASAQVTLHVPQDFPTIQAAIDGAADGDTILAAPGIYGESPDYRGKDVTVQSADGPKSTIIDGGRVLIGPSGSLIGFTIRNDSRGLGPE